MNNGSIKVIDLLKNDRRATQDLSIQLYKVCFGENGKMANFGG